MTSRRQFLLLTGAGLAAAGCDQVERFTGLADDPLAPFRPPTGAELDDVSHLLNRTTFGPRPGDHARVTAMGAAAWLDEHLSPDSISDRQTDRLTARYEALRSEPLGELMEFDEKDLLDQMIREKILRATHSKRQLLEVMVDFWSDHFNIDPSKGDSKWLKPADDRLVIRRHALGKFSDLVRASALSPSMLWYLDGRVNQKKHPADHPNENYGRELLELHTLGVHGGYTQQDVMEAARTLTGWTVRERSKSRYGVGVVEFNAKLHDDGPKTILGQTLPAGGGEKDIERLIDLVAHHPATASYLATKLCRRFIADEPPEAAVKSVAATFLSSKGDIPATLRALFATPEFLAAKGGRIKRPFHFIVSALRACSATTDAGKPLQDYLHRMGHAPFHYPTPDGYPEEPQPWMATLLWRWRFALRFAGGKINGTNCPKDALAKAAGSPEKLHAHLLGRMPNDEEVAALKTADSPIALLLAAPAFQTF